MVSHTCQLPSHCPWRTHICLPVCQTASTLVQTHGESCPATSLTSLTIMYAGMHAHRPAHTQVCSHTGLLAHRHAHLHTVPPTHLPTCRPSCMHVHGHPHCYDRFSSPVRMENRGGSEVKEILTAAHREFGGCAHRCTGKPKCRDQDRASPRRRGRARSGTAEE